MLKVFSLVFVAAVIGQVSSDSNPNNGITCQFCLVGLASMTQNLQANQDQMDEMGSQISQGCDQVYNKDQRGACRATLDDNFNLFLANFLTQPGTSPQDFCTGMGYCP